MASTRSIRSSRSAPFSPGTPPPTAPDQQLGSSQPGYTPNIGNRLDDAGINWRWYSGGWNDALYNNVAANAELFQFHHQPFAYYTKYAPFVAPAPSANYSTSPPLNPATTGPNAHLQDEAIFLADVASGNLPAMRFVKRIGKNNESSGMHPAEARPASRCRPRIGCAKQQDLERLRHHHYLRRERSRRRPPPVRPDGWGVGVRVPTIIVSPFVRKGTIDSHEYETVSILKLIERRFNLTPLSARDANPKVNDLTTAFDFEHDDD